MTNAETVGIIPARGGSKGIPRKNIQELDGEPLIAYSIEAGLGAKCIDSVIVSTDDQEIAEIAQSYGGEIPFIRPSELATDKAPTAPVITHALNELERSGRSIDTFVLLQPTSPLRTSHHIDEAYSLYRSVETSSVISVCESYATRWEETPEGAKQLNYHNAPNRRQDRKPEYVINGAIYITDRDEFANSGEIKTGRIELYRMNELSSIDIDTPFDLWLAEKIMTEWQDND